MTTLVQARTMVRSQLDEATARFWTDAELTDWINRGCKDIARRSENLLVFSTTVTAVAGTNKYVLPTDLLRIHRVEFKPTGSTQLYPVDASTYDEMTAIWGINQGIQSSYPSYFCLWGIPGVITGASAFQIQFFPVPSQTGTFNIFYYGLPTTAVADADVLGLPGGWEDLVVDYCEYRAKRKAKDPTWQEAKQLYDEALLNMIDMTRQLHDESQSVSMRYQAVPGWLYGSEY